MARSGSCLARLQQFDAKTLCVNRGSRWQRWALCDKQAGWYQEGSTETVEGKCNIRSPAAGNEPSRQSASLVAGTQSVRLPRETRLLLRY